MTWKPTDEMVITALHKLWGKAEDDAVHMEAALIAVQPLIAAEARAKALEEAAQVIESDLYVHSDLTRAIRSLISMPVEGR